MQSCIFCLEDLKDQTPLNFSNERVCSCKIYSHVDCWMQYHLHKGFFECPICHFKLDQNHRRDFTIISVNRSVSFNVPTEQMIQINLPQEPQSLNFNSRRVRLFAIFIILGVTIFAVYRARV